MTAFRFVTLVCDSCYAAFDPGTALTEPDARAEAADRGWTMPGPDEDRCGTCSGRALSNTAPLDDVLGIGEPILL